MSAHPSFIAVNLTPAMSGYFATLYSWTEEDGMAYYEPWTTGLGRYATPEEANIEGERWAADEGVEFRPATPERIASAEAAAADFRKRMSRVIELRDGGMGLKEAMEQARAEGL